MFTRFNNSQFNSRYWKCLGGRKAICSAKCLKRDYRDPNKFSSHVGRCWPSRGIYYSCCRMHRTERGAQRSTKKKIHHDPLVKLWQARFNDLKIAGHFPGMKFISAQNSWHTKGKTGQQISKGNHQGFSVASVPNSRHQTAQPTDISP